MNWFSKKVKNECQHKYKYYNKQYSSDWNSIHVYNFVCLKCGHKHQIETIDLMEKIEEFKDLYLKNKALGAIDTLKSSNLHFTVRLGYNYGYSGEWITKLIQDYALDGIDITEIDEILQKQNEFYAMHGGVK